MPVSPATRRRLLRDLALVGYGAAAALIGWGLGRYLVEWVT